MTYATSAWVTLSRMPSPTRLRPDRYRSGSRLPRWAKVLLVLLSIAVVAVLAVVALFVWALSGGWDGLRPTASADDRRVVTARRAAGDELSELTSRTLDAAAPGRELARIRFDDCQQGQNNWKRHDGYTLRCELAESVVLSATDVDVTTAGRRLDRALRAAGWRPEEGSDDLNEPDEPDHSDLRMSRSGRFTAGERLRHQLDVGVTTRPTSPVVGAAPYDPATLVQGDLAAFREALAGSGLKIVVRTSVRYFDDG